MEKLKKITQQLRDPLTGCPWDIEQTFDSIAYCSIEEAYEVVGMISVNDMDANILVVSENGYGKRSSLEDYRLTNRGGKGVKTISITEKTGKLVSLKSVSDNDDLMIINNS